MYFFFVCLIFALNFMESSIASSTGDVFQQGIGVDFWDSMWCVKDKIPALKNCTTWKHIEASYNLHIVNALNFKNNRIPKIIHQVWVGSPFPEKYKQFQKTWISHHPEWIYKLWTDKEIDELNLTYRKAYDAASNMGAKSDIARYEILYRYGGLYVDTDFECVKPFDIFHHCLDFYTGAAHYGTCTAFMAIIGCVPGHPILLDCLNSLDIAQIKNIQCSMDILQSTGPGHFSTAINKYLQHSDDASVVFPAGYFYPWPHYYRDQNSPEEIRQWIRNETFAIHHWHASWNKSVGKTPRQASS